MLGLVEGHKSVVLLALSPILGATASAQHSDGNNCSSSCSCNVADGCFAGPLNTSIPNVMLLSDSIGATGSGYFTNVKALLGPSNSAITGAGVVGNAFVHHTGGVRKLAVP